MMIFTESLFWEEYNYIKKNESVYGTDNFGNEFEITPGMINAYHEKFGGRWKPHVYSLSTGVASIFPAIMAKAGTRDLLRANEIDTHSLPAGLIPGFAGIGVMLGGMKLGDNLANHQIYNDIVDKKRRGQL